MNDNHNSENNLNVLNEKGIANTPWTAGKLFAILPALLLSLFAIWFYFSGIIQLWLGLSEAKDQHEAKAVDYFSWAIATNPHLAQAYYNRAKALLIIEKAKDGKADYSAAASDIDHAIQLQPANLDYYAEIRAIHRDKREFSEEIKDLTKMIPINKWRTDGFLNDRADLYDRLDQSKAAHADRQTIIDHLNKQLAMNPQSGYVLIERADQYKALGALDKAIADYENGLKINEQTQPDLLKLAYVYASSGRDAKAIETYGKAIALAKETKSTDQKTDEKTDEKAQLRLRYADVSDQDTDDALFRRAQLYIKNNQLEKALADAQELVQRSGSKERHGFHAKVLKMMGQKTSAQTEVNKTLQKIDKEWYADGNKQDNKSCLHSARADFYASAGEYKNALREYSIALSLDPETFAQQLYLDSAAMYTKLGDYDNAIKYYSKAIAKSDSDDDIGLTEAYMGLAELHMLQHRPNLTVEDCNKILRDTDGGIPGQVNYWRARAYKELGKNDLAKLEENKVNNLEFLPESHLDGE